MENKKAEDCYFFLNGYCSKGSGCEFRHAEGAKDRPICMRWLLEECSDPNCPSRHPTLPRQKDGSRTLCFYNQGCTRPDCPFFHTGTTTSPAAPRPDKETALATDLTPRNVGTKTTSIATVPTAGSTNSSVVPPVKAEQPPPAQVRPGKKHASLPELTPRQSTQQQQLSAPIAQGAGTAHRQSFVKSLEEILKEKKAPGKPAVADGGKSQSPTMKHEEKRGLQRINGKPSTPAGRQAVPQTNTQRGSELQGKRNDTRRRPLAAAAAAQNTPAVTARPSFGVKTLDELLKERQANESAAEEKKQATASAAGAKGQMGTSPSSSTAGVKRAREETTDTAKLLPEPQQKQSKSDPAFAAPTPNNTQEDDDFEKELEEIGIDFDDADTSALDDDELKELLAE